MKESQVINLIVINLAEKRYGNNIFEFLQEFEYEGYIPDLIIKAGNRNIAAIEIKTKNKLNDSLDSFSVDYYFKFNTRFFIYTDGDIFHIYDRFNNPEIAYEYKLNDFIKKVTKVISTKILGHLKDSFANTIVEIVNNSTNISQDLRSYILQSIDRIKLELKLSTSYTLYFESSKEDSNSFEQVFFQKLINDGTLTNIYRYCSFYRAFDIITNDSIAMHGLPGMNDTTEPNYVDNYLNEPIDKEEVWEMAPKSIATINRRFIISCTELQDELLPWRLYGDDAKGACLEMVVDNNIMANNSFYLGKVKYADDNGHHKELDFLKEIIKEIRLRLLLNVRFVLLYVWRHFFKPKEYAYEKEVRLLYVLRNKNRPKRWILTTPYEIVNPLVIFSLNEFPLTIKHMTIGPKTPEKKLNRAQLTQMLHEKKSPITISESLVNVYR